MSTLNFNMWETFMPLCILLAAFIGFVSAAPQKGKKNIIVGIVKSRIFQWSYITISAIVTMIMVARDSFYGVTELASQFVMQGDNPAYLSLYTVVLLGGVMLLMATLLYIAIAAGAYVRPKNVQFETFSWFKRKIKTGLVHPTELNKQFSEIDFSTSKCVETTIKLHPKPDPLAEDGEIKPVRLAINPEILKP